MARGIYYDIIYYDITYDMLCYIMISYSRGRPEMARGMAMADNAKSWGSQDLQAYIHISLFIYIYIYVCMYVCIYIYI